MHYTTTILKMHLRILTKNGEEYSHFLILYTNCRAFTPVFPADSLVFSGETQRIEIMCSRPQLEDCLYLFPHFRYLRWFGEQWDPSARFRPPKDRSPPLVESEDPLLSGFL